MMAQSVVDRGLKSIIWVLLAFMLAGCSPYLQPMQTSSTTWLALNQERSLGQTFVARYDGLEGVQVYLNPLESGSGDIFLHLRSGPGETEDLGISRLPINLIQDKGYYNFNFIHQNKSHNQYYYAYLEIVGDGQVEVGSAQSNTYLNGSLYENHLPQDFQIAFRLSYQLAPMLLGLIHLVLIWSGIIIAGSFLFILPGWALISVGFPGSGKFSWEEKFGMAAGLSLSIYPALLLLTNIMGLNLGALYALVPGVLGVGTLSWRYLQGRKRNQEVFESASKSHSLYSGLPLNGMWHKFASSAPSDLIPKLAFVIVAGLLVFTRFWPLQSLDAPMFGDSYQHTMIAQLLIDNAGLFNSWQPYSDLNTFTYHFGFHSLTAVFHWITGMDLAISTLWVGQLINILAVLSLYPLAVRIGKSQWAGVIAVLLAGLLVPMPMYYVNWGRYTQLTGQAILPAVVLLCWTLTERKRYDFRLILLSSLAMAGLALSHYRVLIFAVLFVFALIIFGLRNKATALSVFHKVFWVGVGAGLIFLPWFVQVYGGKILHIFSTQVTTSPKTAGTFNSEYNSIGNILSYLPGVVWVLLLISIGYLLWIRNKEAAIVITWWLFIILAANPNLLTLPGAGVISNFAMLIAAYIPAAVLIPAALCELSKAVLHRFKPIHINETAQTNGKDWVYKLALVVALISTTGFGLWGTRQRMKDPDYAQYALVTRPDVRAANWIKENTPAESRFLVNSFFAFGGTAVVGSDGGWWLPLLARRQTNLPPLSYGLENEPWAGYVEWINELPAEIIAKGILDPDVLEKLDEKGITHIYIGQQQGSVNHNGPQFLDHQTLLSSSIVKPIYHQDRVWIFELAR